MKESETRKFRIPLLFLAAILLVIAAITVYQHQTDLSVLPNKSELAALSIDAAISEGHENLYNNYWIDYSKSNFLDPASKIECTSSRRFLTEINSDSLFDVDTTWKKYRYLTKGLFTIESARRFGNKITVDVSIFYGIDAGKAFEIDIEKIGDHYRILEQRIICIS